MPILKCPICRKDVPLDDPNTPFCSDRCRTIDLGKWASGDYKISTPIFDPEELESLQNEQSRAEHESHDDTQPGSRWKN